MPNGRQPRNLSATGLRPAFAGAPPAGGPPTRGRARAGAPRSQQEGGVRRARGCLGEGVVRLVAAAGGAAYFSEPLSPCWSGVRPRRGRRRFLAFLGAFLRDALPLWGGDFLGLYLRHVLPPARLFRFYLRHALPRARISFPVST
eukprot:5081404-Prymnesium_polylepis.1